MGWTYNTIDPDAPTMGLTITIVATILTALSLVSVLLRAYVRFLMIKAPGVDDWIIFVSWIASAGFAIVTILQTKWGLGLDHIADLPAENIYQFGLIQYAGAPFYISSILGFKLALLFSYLRFVPKGIYRHLCIGVIVACVLFHLSFLLVQINLCQPIAKQWDPSITGGSCLPGVPVYTSMASITIVFDLIVMFLPFPVLAKSQIQKRKKVVLLGLFTLGVFITIIQIIRIQTVNRLVNYTDSAPLILWSTVENNLGIIVACIPTLAPLVKYFSERSHGTYSGDKSKSNEVGTRYAMQTWKSGRTKGLQSLGSRNDDQTDGSFEGHIGKGNNSTEFILEPGITKKVEVTITRA
ncbi:hypothetical protein B0T16DRAFT_85461 [Cercophora newfieldiana]|uniref:Rhodopsin domain-containing protein n=1 Tax=Cercophora newfieldiana TaxID=92897 RepID=A0AA40CU85_9PEZI|nr:hypothetical protein B0T16DRAFT_85461 [Cercophora newfieldiana]